MCLTIVHIALGGCLRAPPVSYGLTADTGGHIAFVLAAAVAQAARDPSAEIDVVTRRFDDPQLGAVHWSRTEAVAARVNVARIATHDRRYLEKEALSAELPAFTENLVARLERAARRPTVIHAHFADAAAVALVVRERFGIPFVYTPHSLALDKARRCGGREAMSARVRLERQAIETADAIIVSSRDEAECQIAAYDVAGAAHRTHLVPPGVPTLAENAPGITAPLAFAEPDRPLVLAIARPTHKKNLVAVAEAFVGSRLRDAANLVILAGQHAVLGDEEREVLATLHGILDTPALAGRVALPLRHDSADVRALYRRAARSGGVFVSPALHEPFGLTLLEAAAAGLPVVATRHGGAVDIVRLIGHGLVVDPLDRQAIAAACLGVIEEPRLRRTLAQASRGYADVFSWDRYAQRSMEIYAGLSVAAARRDAVAA